MRLVKIIDNNRKSLKEIFKDLEVFVKSYR